MILFFEAYKDEVINSQARLQREKPGKWSNNSLAVELPPKVINVLGERRKQQGKFEFHFSLTRNMGATSGRVAS